MKIRSLCATVTVSALLVSAEQAQADPWNLFREVIQAQAALQDQSPPPPPQDAAQAPPSGVGKYIGAGIACAAGIAIVNNNVKSDLAKLALSAVLCTGAFKIAKYLTDKDKAEFEARSQELLQRAGPTQEVWIAPESGKQVTISTGEAQVSQQSLDFVVDNDVAAPEAGTTVEAATYVVIAQKLNVRNAPSTDVDSKVIGFFNKGDNVEVIGRTPDGQWALVGDQGVVVGYAATQLGAKDLLVPQEQAAQAEAAQAARRTVARASPRILRNAATGASDLRVADSTSVKTVKVIASTQCKAFSASIGKTTDKKTGCAQPNGQWAMA